MNSECGMALEPAIRIQDSAFDHMLSRTLKAGLPAASATAASASTARAAAAG